MLLWALYTVTVWELFKLGQTPGKVCTLFRDCVGRSGVYKALKCLKEKGSALPKVGSTPGHRVGAPKLIENAGEKVGRNPSRSMENGLDHWSELWGNAECAQR